MSLVRALQRPVLVPSWIPLFPSPLPLDRPKAWPSQPEAVVCLGPADLPECLSLDRLALGGLWTEDQWLRELMDPQRPVVGWRQGENLLALASAWLVVDELQITAVAVHPDHRRRGLGRLVVEGLLLVGREAGAERATLEVSLGNGAARALYASVGFQEVAVRRAYYRNGDDALIEWKEI